MLSLSHCQRIFLAKATTDMRKGRNTLAAMVRDRLGKDPLSGDAFIFVGKGARMVKILMWDVSGFWLAQKRLESGRFAVRGKIKERDAKGSWPLSVAEVMAILEGIDIRNAAYHQHYAHPPGRMAGDKA
jgi:transposase